MPLKVTEIRETSPYSKTFRFESETGRLPVFQSGQYASFRLRIGSSELTRPYTISSAPYETRGARPFFEITVRRNRPYLVPDWLFENVKVVHVLSDEPDWQGEKGFLSREIIEKYSVPDCTYMFCGPYPMYAFLRKTMDDMGVTGRRFRHDAVNNPSDVTMIPGFPKGKELETHTITVVRGIHEDVIEAKGSESVAVALERAAIKIDTHCRSGECGFCRSQLLSGEIFVSPVGDGRRRMDREMGWFHPCGSWPLTDLKIKIPIM